MIAIILRSKPAHGRSIGFGTEESIALIKEIHAKHPEVIAEAINEEVPSFFGQGGGKEW